MTRDGTTVRVAGDLGRALKSLKRQVESAGVLRELRDRAAYRPPSVRRRTKARRARKRAARVARWQDHEDA